MKLLEVHQEDAYRAVEIATLSLMIGVKAATLSRAMGELTNVGREIDSVENSGHEMNLLLDCHEDAIRAVENTTPSLMSGEKAATLSSAMGELTYVGRGVYREQNRKVIIIVGQVSLPATKSIVVVKSVAEKSEAVKGSVVVEDKSSVPLNLTKNSVTKDSSDYSNLEEVLAELSQKLGVFPPAQKQKSYEVAEWKEAVKKYTVKNGCKKDKRKYKLEVVVLKDAEDPHLPTSLLGVYWMALGHLYLTCYNL